MRFFKVYVTKMGLFIDPYIFFFSYLSNLTGYDVKMAKIEPHHEGEYEDRERLVKYFTILIMLYIRSDVVKHLQKLEK